MKARLSPVNECSLAQHTWAMAGQTGGYTGQLGGAGGPGAQQPPTAGAHCGPTSPHSASKPTRVVHCLASHCLSISGQATFTDRAQPPHHQAAVTEDGPTPTAWPGFPVWLPWLGLSGASLSCRGGATPRGCGSVMAAPAPHAQVGLGQAA